MISSPSRCQGLLSFLAYNRFTGEVKGIKNLQEEYEQIYGRGRLCAPGDVGLLDFSNHGWCRLLLMLALVSYGLFLMLRDRDATASSYLAILTPAIALPYIANSTGWIFTEIGSAALDCVWIAEDIRCRVTHGRRRRGLI